ncbi:MAG: hypothetical protein Q7S40_13535 [Opitutaceae bacterium]|nr:hypothetical protein [Opitutaceae bacterium]
MNDTATRRRNPGPTWGFRFLLAVQRLPRPLLRPLLMAGTAVAVGLMPVERGYSRAYLAHVLPRRPRWRDVWRHFSTYLEFLLLRLRVGGGEAPRVALDPENSEAFETLIQSGEPALFGTFHFGHSDLLGFLLSARDRRVAMIRLRVTNADDTAMLEQQFAGAVSFIWVNQPEDLIFALKAAVERGDSLAMQCDRLFTSKAEAFHFLGVRRLFPFTIYHLAVLFGRPVMFCFGLPDGVGGTRVCAAPLFRPDPALGREENFRRGRSHFQAVLARLEALVRAYPTLWFNFIPLNPEPESQPAPISPGSAARV